MSHRQPVGRRRPGHYVHVQLQLLADPDRHIHVVLLYVPTYICRDLACVRIHHIHFITTTIIAAYSSSTCIWLPHRKSRLVKLVEKLHKPVDDHVKERYQQIFQAKERYQAVLREKARLSVVFTLPYIKATFVCILMGDWCTNHIRKCHRVYVVCPLRPPCTHTFTLHCPGLTSPGEKS